MHMFTDHLPNLLEIYDDVDYIQGLEKYNDLVTTLEVATGKEIFSSKCWKKEVDLSITLCIMI